MSKLSYIVNAEQVSKIVKVETPSYGVFYFILKNDEKKYFAYRRVDTGETTYYYVRTTLPTAVFNSHIKTGIVDKQMSV